MTPTPPEVVPAQVGGVVVTQADHEAYISMSMLPEFDLIDVRAGRWDRTTGMQAFARHRLATIEECARACESQVRLGYTGYDLTGFVGENRIARRCATAIRQLSAPPPPPAVVGEGGNG